jgi:cytidylate kinase
MAIVAMTEHVGTHSLELGQLAAKRLGYRYKSSEALIKDTSERYSVAPAQLVIVDERRPHFWERLKTDTERFAGFFRAVVLKEMAQDRIVLTGRSVAHLLPDHGCGLRVRLVGPFKERAQIVAAEEKLALAMAERRVRDHDREMRARIQTLFGVDIEDDSAYSLVFNTFAMPLEVAAMTISSLAQELDRTVRPEQWCRMRDAALAAEVRAALMLNPKIGHAPFEVQCSSGIVQVNGPGLVPPWDDLVNDLARRVEGVKSVEVIAEEQPVPVRPS